MAEPVLEAVGLVREFPDHQGKPFRVLDEVSFRVKQSETFGIVGESGCGKSTLARIALKLLPPTEGAVRIMGREITKLSEREMRPLRRDIQAVFQDPMSSLNPRLTVLDIIGEPLRVSGTPARERASRVRELLELVGLPLDGIGKRPHVFSGGQRQRISIARALAAKPRLVVCDEATSALDVSVQAQILNLIRDLQQRLGISFIFISHNLAAVRHVSDSIAVMYLGRIVEMGPEKDIFDNPQHPYTRALLAAVLEPNTDEQPVAPLSGEAPSVHNRPSGCHFHPRCPKAQAICKEQAPNLDRIDGDRVVRCYFPGDKR